MDTATTYPYVETKGLRDIISFSLKNLTWKLLFFFPFLLTKLFTALKSGNVRKTENVEKP